MPHPVRMRLVALVCALALTGCAIPSGSTPSTSSASPSPTTTRLQRVYESCPFSPGPKVGDAGMSLDIDTKGEEDAGRGDPVEVIDCVLSGLAAPDHIRSHVGSTRALDGQQVDEWDGLRARWTYHPDSGLRLTVVDTRR